MFLLNLFGAFVTLVFDEHVLFVKRIQRGIDAIEAKMLSSIRDAGKCLRQIDLDRNHTVSGREGGLWLSAAVRHSQNIDYDMGLLPDT